MEREKIDLKILCVIKHEHKEAWHLAGLLVQWFKEHGVQSVLVSSHKDQEELSHIAQECHAVLVVGGDGTMLAAARSLYASPLPLFGINFGRVGFLTEADPNQWEYWVERFLVSLYEIYEIPTKSDSQRLFIEEHNIIECTVLRNDKIIHKGYAINDAVIARAHIARTISLSIHIDKNRLGDLRCDGLIISSPLGATAYAISAHGPLALPGLDALIITPICPFANAFPPCVVAGSSLVSVVNEDSTTPVILTLDGQENIELKYKDLVNISENKTKMHLLISNKAWYTQRLVERGFIRQGPGIQK